MEATASTGFFRLTGRVEGLRVGAALAGIGSALGAVFAGDHVGTIEASLTGFKRGSPAAISAAAALSGRGRRGSRSGSERSKGRNDKNLSHDCPLSQCVIARRFVISGLKRNPGSTAKAGERSSLMAPPPQGGAQAVNEWKQ
ncbi:MAG: hypothetical protein EXR03_06685 [Pseudolabrys sp.]|nr:hypothetical protein [Pseudolabrys sp.]MSP32490.1 hypothetical protein [Pseudolabrys sp.]